MKRFILFFLVSISVSFASESLVVGNKAIYGKDNRRFIRKNFESSKLKQISKSIGLIFSKDLSSRSGNFFEISASPLSENSAINVCSKEKFVNHKSLNSCTGFLVSNDTILTAGHCFMSEFDCDSKLIAFNVLVEHENKQGFKIKSDQVYKCKEIISSSFDVSGGSDFALIRLDREVKNTNPLKLRTSGKIESGQNLYMVGHPLGLPQIISNKARVLGNEDGQYFKANLDSFEGNSGSPVFNSDTDEVEGILVSGEEDFEYNQISQCSEYKKYSNSDIVNSSRGESVFRILNIKIDKK